MRTQQPYTITLDQPHPRSNAAARLAFYKKRHGSAWRDFPRYRHGWTRYGKTPEYMHNGRLLSSYEFHNQIGYADELAPRAVDHQGWYTTEDGDAGTIRGAVLRIRSARFTQYVPAVIWSDCQGHVAHLTDAERVPRGSDEDTHAQAIREAALRADRLAELAAEQDREADHVFRLECTVEDTRETIAQIRAEVSALVAGIRASVLAPVLCDHMRAQIRRARRDIHTHLQTLADTRRQLPGSR